MAEDEPTQPRPSGIPGDEGSLAPGSPLNPDRPSSGDPLAPPPPVPQAPPQAPSAPPQAPPPPGAFGPGAQAPPPPGAGPGAGMPGGGPGPGSPGGGPGLQPPPQAGFAPARATGPSNGAAVASLALSIVGIVLFFFTFGLFFFLNLPASIAGWVFGISGRRKVDRGETDQQRGLAQAGMWIGIVGTILGILALIVWVLLIVVFATVDYNDANSY